jgi:hypothetical protein
MAESIPSKTEVETAADEKEFERFFALYLKFTQEIPELIPKVMLDFQADEWWSDFYQRRCENPHSPHYGEIVPPNTYGSPLESIKQAVEKLALLGNYNIE